MRNADQPIETGTAADWEQIYDLFRTAFHGPPDDAVRDHERAVHEPDRSLLVRDDGVLVAHAGGYGRELTLPGGVLAAAHVSQVTVAATHRRRGLLTRLMHHQLRAIRSAGREPIAVLWASEGRIYPRYGYGQASQRLDLTIDIAQVGFPGRPGAGGPGRLRSGPAEGFRPDLVALFERLRASRPGWSGRDARWWDQILGDLPSQRGGQTELRAVVHESPTGVDGYALFRTFSAWTGANPHGEVRVRELVTASTEATEALWRFLLGVDLTRTAKYSFAALDDPLQHLVAEPRQLGADLIDGLWVRVVDLPAALTTRRYAVPVEVVIEVTDPLLPENGGRWRLTGDRSGAECVRTGDPADLALDVRDVGTVLLGGPSLGALADAGRVRELRPGTLVGASTAFGWDRAPASLEVF